MKAHSIVSIIECSSYEQPEVSKAVNQALELAGLDNVFQADKSVLIKPNLLSTRQPDQAVTTHPTVVHAAARFAIDRGCAAAIGDSPPFAGEKPTRWARLLDATGMREIASSLGIDLRRFEDASVEIDYPSGRIYRAFEIATAVAQADTIVNIPKLKTHGLTLLTGAVKNVFGCVPGIRKGLFHVRAAEDRETFAQMLVDLCAAIRPAVHLMDAVVAMEGEGPSSGIPKPVGAVLASSDPVALDAVASALVGVDPMSVTTTRLGHEQGLGCADVTRIEVRGASIADLRIPDFALSSGTTDWARIPAPIRQMLRRQLIPSPRMDKRACIACGDCVTGCPVDAITDGQPPRVDYGLCIRCYCCQEVCPASAVTLRSGLLSTAISWLRQKK